jgi:hypothetical protein
MRHLVILLVLLLASPVLAQTSGTIIDLGGGFSTFQDSSGRSGTIMDRGGGFQSYQFTAPPAAIVPPAATIQPRANFQPPAWTQPLAPPQPPTAPYGRYRR